MKGKVYIMAKCKNCGANVPFGVTSCPNCGAALESISDTVSNAANALGAEYDKIKGADKTAYYDPEDLKKNKVIFALCYLWILFFLPLVACPDSKAGKFHANQGLLVLLTGIIISVACTILSVCLCLVPFGWIIAIIISSVLGLVNLVLAIIGIVNAVNEKIVELPIIGKVTIIK